MALKACYDVHGAVHCGDAASDATQQRISEIDGFEVLTLGSHAARTSREQLEQRRLLIMESSTSAPVIFSDGVWRA